MDNKIVEHNLTESIFNGVIIHSSKLKIYSIVEKKFLINSLYEKGYHGRMFRRYLAQGEYDTWISYILSDKY
jgi:hypothetical protein